MKAKGVRKYLQLLGIVSDFKTLMVLEGCSSIDVEAVHCSTLAFTASVVSFPSPDPPSHWRNENVALTSVTPLPLS